MYSAKYQNECILALLNIREKTMMNLCYFLLPINYANYLVSKRVIFHEQIYNVKLIIFFEIIAENKKIMTNVCYIKQELNSFVENKLHCTDDDSINVSNENILAPFPLKTENELMIIESKLQSEDLAYTNKLVCKNI